MADEILKWYGPQWQALFRDAQDDALALTGDAIVNKAKRDAPVFLGNTRRSIARTEPHDLTTTRRAVEVGSAEGNSDAWKYVMALERGRRAGRMPPIESLLRWVELKLHVGQSQTGAASKVTGQRRWRKNSAPDRDKQIRSVAFLVARAIGRHGTKAQPFLTPAFNEEVPKVYGRFQKALEARRGMVPPAR